MRFRKRRPSDCEDDSRERRERFGRLINQLNEEIKYMSATDLAAAVAENTEITGAVVTKLAAGSGVDGTAVTAATTQIQQNNAALKAALAPHPPKPVYEHQGEGAIDPVLWPTAPFKTTAGAQLYYFASDVDGGPPTAPASSEWVAYTGEVIAA